MLEGSQPQVKVIDYGSVQYHQAAQLRYRLFYQEHNIPFTATVDSTEPEDIHLAIVNGNEGNQVIAYGRLAQKDGFEFQIYQMVVEPTHQGQGFGARLLNAILEIALQQKAQNVTLNARVTKVGFYQKFGFTTVGEVFPSETTGIPHIKMQKTVSSDLSDL